MSLIFVRFATLLNYSRTKVELKTMEAVNGDIKTQPRRGRATTAPTTCCKRNGRLERTEPVILIGDCGTGKAHLQTGLCVAVCRQKKQVRFATAAALFNELVETKQQLQLRSVLARWECHDLIAIDRVG
jgi:DNA replication protein DnaC